MRTCILVFLLGIFLNSHAQKEAYNWYFGKNAALNFSTGEPVSLTGSAMHASNGSSSLSDSAGNLLFYSNGAWVWNRNHAVMQNGEGRTDTSAVMMVNVAVPVQIPNAFTPNGDGLNDTFKPLIRNPDQVVQYHMAICNRWGECFFETSDTSKGWDGTNAPPGIYAWVISYVDLIGNVNEVKGSVALIR